LEEQEFKLRVTAPEAFETVADAPEIEAVAADAPQTLAMTADYIDTADLRLLRAGYAYRVRKEGQRWVATVKADLGGAAEGGLHRHQEWEATVTEPAPDLTVFADDRLRQDLAAIRGEEALTTLFRVTMERRVRMLALAGGARAEWAADRGRILAGGKEEAVCEVELELKEGPLQPLHDLIQTLRNRYPLEPDDRTKFARGLALAGLAPAPE
jgi:inorganic triphosphatase YgiF